MKKIVVLLLFFFTLSLSNGFIFFSSTVFASSSYVLPYPSAMPGGISYKMHLVWEKIMQYVSFGDFGQFDYSLKQSDKYVVEAKTLFEYNQYLLGFSALQKSNDFFVKILPNLVSAKQHGKDIADKRQLLQEAAAKHIEILQKMLSETPSAFVWNPEKAQTRDLSIHALINESIQMREKDL